MESLRQELEEVRASASTDNKDTQTDAGVNECTLSRKYADAKRRLNDCVALLRDYEQVSSCCMCSAQSLCLLQVNRIGEQRVRALQHDVEEIRQQCEKELEAVRAEVVNNDYSKFSSCPQQISELGTQLSSERAYAEQLEEQLEAHTQLVDMLKQQVYS